MKPLLLLCLLLSACSTQPPDIPVVPSAHHPYAPVAVIKINPGTGNTDTVFAFDGTASHDVYGKPVSIYSWDFGDGSLATGKTARHRYSKPDNYRVFLVVMDSRGVTGISYVWLRVAK